MACGRRVLAGVYALFASIQLVTSALPNSFPHSYPNQPTGDFSPAWQNYFVVKDKLPNVTFPLPRTFAGNIPVQRAGHPNDTLFFVGFEKANGSLTKPASSRDNEPWGIWLNGGPGSSSLYGLFFENGPMRIGDDYRLSPNPHSWDKLADYFWIDQPVGVGYSTADADGYVANEDQMGADFMGFLANLVKVFPSLATRPLHLTGESYAGVYIPYIMKAYFGMKNPPVKIAKFAIGDGSITDGVVFQFVPALSVIETYPQLIGYDPEVYNYFREQSQLCGFDIKLTYPQNGKIPPVPLVSPTSRDISFLLQNGLTRQNFMSQLKYRYTTQRRTIAKRAREENQREWKRGLSKRENGTIDPWYGCFLLDHFIDYAQNFTFPWNLTEPKDTFSFNVYDVSDATSPPVNTDASVFLNDNRTRTAIHAPTSKDWAQSFQFVFGDNGFADISPPSMDFMTELATNATARGVDIILYSGNDDALIAHRSTEIAIQNTTFGGIQGFTVKPSTPWFSGGKFAGIIRQERGWTYVLFDHASHMVPTSQPAAAFTFLREFVLGNNKQGLVTKIAGKTLVIGGENTALAADTLPGSDGIRYGPGSDPSTYVAPAATRAAWQSFIRTATASPTPIPTRRTRS
ncbi:Alpha/Beta hydrolase protein [Collybia nuda]|uniref:Carboxypeptidase n=1 Tax=Collybia nuda TaxID=64659 RepID=A0A9P5Y0V4_9AGAR|nr:Alpha/Beta hydrolase protein [Collybia nuda]